MAFSYTLTFQDIKGTERYTRGTFANAGGSTGGDINTGLKECRDMKLQYTGTTVVSDAAVVNETYPCAGNAVTIVTVADKSGTWEAYGV